jgi:hypothetical protein
MEATATTADRRVEEVPAQRREQQWIEVPAPRNGTAPAEREYVREHIVLGYN